MKKRKYKLYPGMGNFEKREGTIAEMLFNYPYSFFYLSTKSSLIPSFEVLNQTLLSGGVEGGMGPGSTWKPFSITEQDYIKLIDELLKYAQGKRANYLYIPQNLIYDQELNNKYPNPEEWLRAFQLKYIGINEIHQFTRRREYPLKFNDEIVGHFKMLGYKRGSKWDGEFIKTVAFNSLAFQIKNKKGIDILIPNDLNNYSIEDNFGIKRKIAKMELSHNKIRFQTIFSPIPPLVLDFMEENQQY